MKKPGFIHEAYSRFHNYLLGNQLLALFQCFERGIQPGPLATWPKWKEPGRYVKKGEKALTLCMPFACKRTHTVIPQSGNGTEQDEEFTFTHFTYKSHWFVLAQTEGAEYKPAAIPEWNEQAALTGSCDDAFLAKLTPEGRALGYSTYVGGSGCNEGKAIAVESSRDVYVAGWTQSSNFPTVNPIQAQFQGIADAFVSELSAGGSSLYFSTCLGGSSYDEAGAIAVDSSGAVYITGSTRSSNLPLAGAFQGTYGGGDSDAFVSKLGPPPAVTRVTVNYTTSGGVIKPGIMVMEISGAGDIADGFTFNLTPAFDTASLLDAYPTATVFTTGDQAYMNGTDSDFAKSYNATWGRARARTIPAPGHHEYDILGAAGYYSYWGPAAGTPGQGWYSIDLGAWHIVVLNANCAAVGCGSGGAQDTWLRNDLATHTQACTLALFHEPLYTSSADGIVPNTAIQPLWQDLYNANADLVVNGHAHNYERFAPQDANGNLDTARGIIEIIAGTGGETLYGFNNPPASNSLVRNGTTFGVLKLTLHATSFDWQFVPVAGATFTDSGTQACH